MNQTTTRPLPPPSAPPPQRKSAKDPEPVLAPATGFKIETGVVRRPQRITLYGPGGVGKTTLASMIPGKPLFLDLDKGSNDISVSRISGIESLDDLRSIIQSDTLTQGYDSLILDTGTRAEELCLDWTVKNIPHEKGFPIKRLEDYGFGKGYRHVYDTFLLLKNDLERAISRRGQNVVLICHDTINTVPNPAGEDFLRYEPALQHPKSGQNSIRDLVYQWSTHVFYLGFDVVAKDGKGRGGGMRTIWTTERPTHKAKMRGRIQSGAYESLPWNDPAEDGKILWDLVFAEEAQQEVTNATA